MTGPRSLYGRIIGTLAVVLGATATILGVAAFDTARRAADEAYDRLLIGAALQMVEGVTVQEGTVGVDPPASAFETLALAPDDRIFYRVADPAGTVLTGYDDLPPAPGGTAPLRAELRVGDGTYLGVPVRLATARRYLPDAAVPGWADITVAQTRRARAELSRDLTGRALGLIALLSFLAFLAVLAAVKVALAPLRSIAATLEARSPKNLAPLSVAAPPEIETLVRSIDFFMSRLSQHVAVMQRFIADAAHQIRTPLAALSSQVDLLANADERRRAQYQERVRERTEELGRITNQLLSHAMVIHRSEATPLEPLDLSELARTALIAAIPLAAERSLDIGADLPDRPAIVPGDRVSLREALSNLLHNAIRYGAPRRLGIEVAKDAAWCTVAVIDDGPGIPEADWSGAGRPFSSSSGGTGLGLAIVRDVVRAHGGELRFERRPDAFAAVMRLPCAADAAGRPE